MRATETGLLHVRPQLPPARAPCWLGRRRHDPQYMLWLPSLAASAGGSTVYIIRHGEKTFGGGCLNIQGQERANHLYLVFDGSRFAVPSAIFANNYYEGAGGDPARANCERCWLTVQPLAQRLHLTVAFDNGYPPALGGNEGAADAIRFRFRLGLGLG